MASSVRNMRLTSLDDLFSTEETRQAERQKTGEQVLSVPIDQVHDFANNPYKVRQDAELMDMVDSITRLGVHTPCLARPRKEGGYELLSGHRRKTASILAQKDTLPIIVRDIDDDTATILVVDGKSFPISCPEASVRARRPWSNRGARRIVFFRLLRSTSILAPWRSRFRIR